jgi:hypothetical protein
MDELMISGKRYISSRRAGKEYHYHADYIGQLVRAGKVAGQKVGRSWYVAEASLASYLRHEAAERGSIEKKSKTKTVSNAASTPAGQSIYEFVPPEQKQSGVQFHDAKESTAQKIKTDTDTDADALQNKNANAHKNSNPLNPRESALLTYISEKEEPHDSDHDEMPSLGRKEKKEETPRAVTMAVHTQHHSANASPEDDHVSAEEVSVPLRIANRPVQAYYGPTPRIPPYYRREVPAMYAESYKEAADTGRAVSLLILIGLISLVAGFLLSIIPSGLTG